VLLLRIGLIGGVESHRLESARGLTGPARRSHYVLLDLCHVDSGSADSTIEQSTRAAKGPTPHEEDPLMARLRVDGFTISIDGYGAGPHQSLEDPLGVGGHGLHQWMIETRTFSQMQGEEGGTTGVDDDFARNGMADIGAWIMGRNMFGPIRGPWPDDSWRGWWGEEPPYHTPVFVLTSHPRAPLVMKGDTVFHFVTDGIRAALERAVAAAGGRDVRLGGGASTIRQYLQAGLVDQMHLAIAPVLLGSGEHLMTGLDLPALGYACTRHVASEKATHVIISRRS
jgi:dihydrofolate reductase